MYQLCLLWKFFWSIPDGEHWALIVFQCLHCRLAKSARGW